MANLSNISFEYAAKIFAIPCSFSIICPLPTFKVGDHILVSGINVLNIIGDQSTSDTASAKVSVDGHFTNATASESGEFVLELVGIVNDPFAVVI